MSNQAKVEPKQSVNTHKSIEEVRRELLEKNKIEQENLKRISGK